jgi:ubiquinone/menaquinone biosynthesis C-methylase UbiE
VWLRFKTETTDEDLALFREAMLKVAASVNGKLLAGKNIEKVLNKGFNYGLVAILPNKEALAAWQVCPAMKEAQQRFISKYIEDFCAVDIEVDSLDAVAQPQQYDSIAFQYKEAKQHSWRKSVEEYTAFHLLGDVAGKSVLDLACGEGHYARMVKNKGATRVVGVDISSKMIELAEEEEKKNPLGIEYLVADVAALPDVGQFDVIVSAYLLTYANSLDVARKFWEAIYRSLKPGGKVVIVHFNMEQDEKYYKNFEPFGLRIDASKKKAEGDPITLIFKNPDNSEFSFDICYLKHTTQELAQRQAGFAKPAEWHTPTVDPSLPAKEQQMYQPLLGDIAMFGYLITYK